MTELGQRDNDGHRVWSKDGETIVSLRWVDGWTSLLDGPWESNRCGCYVTSCEHDAIRRLIARKAAEVDALTKRIGTSRDADTSAAQGEAVTPALLPGAMLGRCDSCGGAKCWCDRERGVARAAIAEKSGES